MTRKAAERVQVSSNMYWKVRASYSADTLADRHRHGVRQPFEFRGHWYVSIGGMSCRKGHEEDEAYRLVPLAHFDGEASFCGQNRPGFQGDWATNRRAQPEGFYHGMMVKRDTSAGLWVLQGPPILFVRAEPKLAGTEVAMVVMDEVEPIDQEPGEPEAGLQLDFAGNTVEVRPKGNGKPVQLTFDDALKLQTWQASAGEAVL